MGDEVVAAPPPQPRHKGFVLDSALGAMGFLGEFRRVAPTAIWLHTQLGYELFGWLMPLAETDLAFTDTSNASDASKARAFPLLSFGGGLRLTAHLGERVGLYVQPSAGLLKADIANGALSVLGYKNAEGLQPYFAGRIGLEWYQIDRHLALGLTGSVKDATGLKRTIGSDTPLAFDAGVALRYTF